MRRLVRIVHRDNQWLWIVVTLAALLGTALPRPVAAGTHAGALPSTRDQQISRTYFLDAKQPPPGLDTGIDLVTGQKLFVRATGRAQYGYEGGADCTGYPETDPDGQRYLGGRPCGPKHDPDAVLAGRPIGMPIARIGASAWFAVGNSLEKTAETSGRLYLLYNDTYRADNSGGYTVTVAIEAMPASEVVNLTTQGAQSINFLPNPSFEEGPPLPGGLRGWGWFDDPTERGKIRWESGIARTGTRSISLRGAGKGHEIAIAGEVRVDLSKRYRLSVWMKGSPGYTAHTGEVRVYASWLSPPGRMAETPPFIRVTPTPEWQQFTTEVQFPSWALAAIIRIAYQSLATPDQNIVYVDDVSLSPLEQDQTVPIGNLIRCGPGQVFASCSANGEYGDGPTDAAWRGADGDLNTQWSSLERLNSWWQVTFQVPVPVAQVAIWGRGGGDALSGRLEFSDRSSVDFGTLNGDGCRRVVSFASRTTTFVRFHVTGMGNRGTTGFREIEAYSSKHYPDGDDPCMNSPVEDVLRRLGLQTGDLIRSDNPGNFEVDIVHNGQRRWVPNPQTLGAITSRYGRGVRQIAERDFLAIPRGQDIPDVRRDPGGFEQAMREIYGVFSPGEPVKGQLYPLQRGTQIRTGPGLSYPSTIPTEWGSAVPEDNWWVLVLQGPVCADGWEWWNVDRGAIDHVGGTGWAAIKQGCRMLPQSRPPTHVEVRQTTSAAARQGQGLTRLSDLIFTSVNAPSIGSLTITVNEEVRGQQVDGFGASLTDSAAWLVYTQLERDTRQRLLKRLFDPNDPDGAHLRYVRLPMGMSDFSLPPELALRPYEVDGTGKPGYTYSRRLGEFSIDHDRDYIIPVLKEILAINPGITILALPWTPPWWMKDSKSFYGGSLRPEYYGEYASYFARFIQSYNAEGIPIHYVSTQNEPRHNSTDVPTTWFEPEQEALFVREWLGPTLRKAGLSTKILIWEHNWNTQGYENAAYPRQILQDERGLEYISGTAFHCYGGTGPQGDPAAQRAVLQELSVRDLYLTECSGGEWPEARELPGAIWAVLDSMRNGARAALLWNLALRSESAQTGPRLNEHVCNSRGSCRGIVTVDDSQYRTTVDYYALAHFSRFVHRGAVRILTDPEPDARVRHVAFVNPDGTRILVIVNAASEDQHVTIQWHDQYAVLSLPAGAAVTLRWAGTQ